MLTLKDAKPRTVDVTIIVGKLPPEKEGEPFVDDTLVVPMCVPSWIEWNELGLEVPTPESELVRVIKDGKPVWEKESSAVYDEKVALANQRRGLRRLTFALMKAGNFPELKNSPVEEQMNAVQSLDAGVYQALVRTLNTLVNFTQGAATSAGRFRPVAVSATGDADLSEDALESRILENIASNGKGTVDRVGSTTTDEIG